MLGWNWRSVAPVQRDSTRRGCVNASPVGILSPRQPSPLSITPTSASATWRSGGGCSDRARTTPCVHAGRQLRIGPIAFWIVVGTLVIMAAWSITTATYFAFRDDVLTRLVSREADMQFGYEDRIAELRAQIDRLSSRQLLDQEQYETEARSGGAPPGDAGIARRRARRPHQTRPSPAPSSSPPARRNATCRSNLRP